jgi:hypothetical protein
MKNSGIVSIFAQSKFVVQYLFLFQNMADDILLEYLHREIVRYVNERGSPHANSIERLEFLGFQVGQALVERLTKDLPRFRDELDTVKFICKDFWNVVYKKQVDNLRTNHQGVYVLQDNRFRFLLQIADNKANLELISEYLALPCGLIRGALTNLGVTCIVTAEVVKLPECKFQVQMMRV